ncbi:MAG: hypothetical protein H0U76_00670 [Ktedonobacteraceae bacterium]|nr:hypothetical protein [Ktedonobacteraceae bacterium]
MKYFFWIAFAVFLAASIPHVAYFFASFEPSQGPEGVWWWAVSYAIAISIDVTVYLLSYTAFKRYRKYRTPKAVWQHWLLIVMCTVFSWAVNWAYAKQFHSITMLSSAESAAPWLTGVFPFMASAFPLLGIVYTMMAETMSETAAEDAKDRGDQMLALSALVKQTQLPISTLRRVVANTRQNGEAVETPATPATRNTEVLTSEAKEDEKKAITGQFVTVDGGETGQSAAINNSAAIAAGDGNPDKLQMTIEVLKANPDMTDEALATHLSLKRPASARFWRLKAIEILNAENKEPAELVTPVRSNNWATTGTLSNAMGVKR